MNCTFPKLFSMEKDKACFTCSWSVLSGLLWKDDSAESIFSNWHFLKEPKHFVIRQSQYIRHNRYTSLLQTASTSQVSPQTPYGDRIHSLVQPKCFGISCRAWVGRDAETQRCRSTQACMLYTSSTVKGPS